MTEQEYIESLCAENRFLKTEIARLQRIVELVDELLTLKKMEKDCDHEWSADGETCLKCGKKDWM